MIILSKSKTQVHIDDRPYQNINILINIVLTPWKCESYTDTVTSRLHPPPGGAHLLLSPSSALEGASAAGFPTPFQSYPEHVPEVGAYHLNLLLMCSSANTWFSIIEKLNM